jgi:hypothetical protein
MIKLRPSSWWTYGELGRFSLLLCRGEGDRHVCGSGKVLGRITGHGDRLVMADDIPVGKGSKEATFTALAAGFKLDDKVRAYEELGRFSLYSAEEKEIEAGEHLSIQCFAH